MIKGNIFVSGAAESTFHAQTFAGETSAGKGVMGTQLGIILIELKRMKIFVYGLMVILTSCSAKREIKPPAHNSQPEKMDLTNSIEQSVDEFFQRRMRNREMEKMAGKRCEILANDSDYLYFGYPFPSSTGRKLDTIFKTRVQLLNEQFSAYNKIEGYHVNNKIGKSLKSYFDSSINYTSLSAKSSSKFYLEPDRISVNIEIVFVKDFIFTKKYNFIIDLDKSNLEVISIKQL